VEWLSDQDLVIGDSRFRCFAGGRAEDQIGIMKPRRAVEAYAQLLAEERPRSILELGIYGGGSVALFALLTDARITAIDLLPDCPALEAFLDQHDLRDRVRAHYRVDQADHRALAAIVDGPLDLVIDDASHRYGPTKASFNYLFPSLRPGGLYVIEDWNWEHTAPELGDGPDPSELIHQVLSLSTRLPRMVPEIRVTELAVHIRRGPADLKPTRFDIDRHAPSPA